MTGKAMLDNLINLMKVIAVGFLCVRVHNWLTKYDASKKRRYLKRKG
jgi:hypothetical protein